MPIVPALIKSKSQVFFFHTPPKVDLHWSSVALPNPEAGGAWVGPSILVFAARIPPKSLPYLHSWFPKNSIVGLDLYVVWQHSKLESLC